jgi:hypothetical protein
MVGEEGGGGMWTGPTQKSACIFRQSTKRFDRFLQQRAAWTSPRSTKDTILVVSHITGLPGTAGRELWSCNLEIIGLSRN